MGDSEEQKVIPKGTLKIETDDETFEISFQDLNRYPENLLARCVADSIEGAEETIEYERDAKYLAIILDYMRDKNVKVINEILSKRHDELLAILEEARYFLLDDLANKCREHLENYTPYGTKIQMIATNDYFDIVCESARAQKRGLLLFNATHEQFTEKLHYIYKTIRLIDSNRYDVYQVAIKEEGDKKSDFLVFKRPEHSELQVIRDLADDADWYQLVYLLNSTSETIAGKLSGLFSELENGMDL